jgi:hypothetical protein
MSPTKDTRIHPVQSRRLPPRARLEPRGCHQCRRLPSMLPPPLPSVVATAGSSSASCDIPGHDLELPAIARPTGWSSVAAAAVTRELPKLCPPPGARGIRPPEKWSELEQTSVGEVKAASSSSGRRPCSTHATASAPRARAAIPRRRSHRATSMGRTLQRQF